MSRPLLIMISGPYTTDAPDEAARARNLRALNEAALAAWRRGHVPVVGVNNAMPLIELAGPAGDESIMMPLCRALADRCDAVLRIGGPSAGADEEVACVRARGGRVFTSLDEIPDLR